MLRTESTAGMPVSYDDWHLVCSLQLRASGVPPIYDTAIFEKILAEKFDAGDYFCLAQEESENESPQYTVLATQPISAQNDTHCIFLIDHAWTFRWGDARQQLRMVPGLLERLANLTGQKEHLKRERDSLIDKVMQQLPKYAHTYTVQGEQLSAEQRQPLWYVLDEFGSHIGHSLSEPNVRVVPFFDIALTGTAYTLMFPIRDIAQNEEVMRNYVDKRVAELQPCLMLPWTNATFTDQSTIPPLPSTQLFTSNRSVDKPYDSASAPTLNVVGPNGVLKVYTDDTHNIVKHLNHPKFQLTDNIEEANVLWLRQHHTDYSNLRAVVNQFPGESALTVKDLLATAVRLAWHQQNKGEPAKTEEQMWPAWFPLTYNLNTELKHFVACYHNRHNNKLDNTWIVKPWNLARALDMHVTDQLPLIIRLCDSGPKIVSKYINQPVLFHRTDLHVPVKFDIRYIVVVQSVRPLRVLVYKHFWLRFANKKFEMKNYDDYNTHFTVHNYAKPEQMLNMKCDEFVPLFERQHPGVQWTTVQSDCDRVILDAIRMAASVPNALQHCDRSTAMFGVDMMLQHNELDPVRLQPVLLEFNFVPDCERACEFYPCFANELFECMFLPNTPSEHGDGQAQPAFRKLTDL